MKSDTPVLIIKGVCHALAGATVTLGASLAQWMNTDDKIPPIAWLVIIGGMVGGAANSVISFLSSAWSDYKDQRSETKIIEKAVNKTEADLAADPKPAP